MPFDLATAKEVQSAPVSAFDPSTAKPVEESPESVLSRIPGMDQSIVGMQHEPSISDKAIGAGEAGLSMVSGMTTGAAHYVVNSLQTLAEQILKGNYGTPEAANLVEEAAMKGSQAGTYSPRTEAGQEYTGAIGEALDPLVGIIPLTGELNALSATGRMSKAIPKRSDISNASIQEAERIGIKPMTTDIVPPQTFTGKVGQAITERVPIIGTGKVRATQQASRTEAVKSFLTDYGAVETAQAIDDVTADLIAKRAASLKKYSSMKDDVISRLSSKGVVDVTKTVGKIDEEISKMQALKTESVSPAISIMEDFKSSIHGQSISNIELLRKQLGEQLKDPSMASIKTTAEKSASKIYGSLRDDMGDFIRNSGERKDFTKWSVANTRLKNMVAELDNTAIKSVLRTGDITPENARKLLFSRKPSDIRTLYRSLTNEGRRNARVAILQEAVDKIGGIEKVTPENFKIKIGQLSKSTGIFFSGEDKKVIEGLLNALELTSRAGTAGVKPITGAEVTTFAAPTAATYLLGGDPVTGLAATASIGFIGRAFESAPVRNALIKLSNAPRNKWAEIIPEFTAAVQPFIQSNNK